MFFCTVYVPTHFSTAATHANTTPHSRYAAPVSQLNDSTDFRLVFATLCTRKVDTPIVVKPDNKDRKMIVIKKFRIFATQKRRCLKLGWFDTPREEVILLTNWRSWWHMLHPYCSIPERYFSTSLASARASIRANLTERKLSSDANLANLRCPTRDDFFE